MAGIGHRWLLGLLSFSVNHITPNEGRHNIGKFQNSQTCARWCRHVFEIIHRLPSSLKGGLLRRYCSILKIYWLVYEYPVSICFNDMANIRHQKRESELEEIAHSKFRFTRIERVTMGVLRAGAIAGHAAAMNCKGRGLPGFTPLRKQTAGRLDVINSAISSDCAPIQGSTIL
jgi:hypothetical protein